MDATCRSRWYEFQKIFRYHHVSFFFSLSTARNYRQLYLYRKHLMFRNAIIRVGSLNDERYFYPRDQVFLRSKNLRGVFGRISETAVEEGRIRRCYSAVKYARLTHSWNRIPASVFGTRYQKCLRASNPTSICKSVRQIIFLKIDTYSRKISYAFSTSKKCKKKRKKHWKRRTTKKIDFRFLVHSFDNDKSRLLQDSIRLKSRSPHDTMY